MAAEVTVKPSSVLDTVQMCPYDSESDSTALRNEEESAYGSECGSGLDIQNSVEDDQKLMLLEKKNGILQNLYTFLKNENVELKNKCDVSESVKDYYASLKEITITLQEKCDILESQNVSLQEQNVSLENQIVSLKEHNVTCLNLKDALKEDRDDFKNHNASLKEEKDALENQIVSLKKDNDALKKQNKALKNDRVQLEKQTACIKQCELENEKYYTEQVNSLQPLLQEAKSMNENLVYEIESLGKLVQKKDSDILILQDRNYDTEVKLSKTRKYIKHRERERTILSYSINSSTLETF